MDLKLDWGVNRELNVSSSHDKDCNEKWEKDSLSPYLWKLQGEQETSETKSHGFRFRIVMDRGQALQWIVSSSSQKCISKQIWDLSPKKKVAE